MKAFPDLAWNGQLTMYTPMYLSICSRSVLLFKLKEKYIDRSVNMKHSTSVPYIHLYFGNIYISARLRLSSFHETHMFATYVH